MANSDFLRANLNQHIVKNSKSKKMDKEIDIAVHKLIPVLSEKYPELNFEHQKSMLLKDIISMLSLQFPEYSKYFRCEKETSFIRPDGGFLFAKNKRGERRIVLVAEVKKQGTNDKRFEEGLDNQAMGNAIERLGKNLIGIRTIFKNEGVLPFICFGYGYDFKEGSSILDRVITMNEFFPLNQLFIEKDFMPFEPVSMMFRYEPWTVEEMFEIIEKVATRAIEYKFV